MRISTCLAAAAAAAAVLATPASASVVAPAILTQAAPAATEEAEKEKPGPDTVECRRVKVTGSRVKRKRICMTLAQWEAQGRSGRAMATGMQDAGTLDAAGETGM